jgi:hypothetical protein
MQQHHGTIISSWEAPCLLLIFLAAVTCSQSTTALEKMDGLMHPESFMEHCRSSRDEWVQFLHAIIKKRHALADKKDAKPAKKGTHQLKANKLEIVYASGNIVAADPKVSQWYLLCKCIVVKSPEQNISCMQESFIINSAVGVN